MENGSVVIRPLAKEWAIYETIIALRMREIKGFWLFLFI